jgi:adenylylsulfate kinase-like enzyme
LCKVDGNNVRHGLNRDLGFSEIRNFTGIDSEDEAPDSAEIEIDTDVQSISKELLWHFVRKSCQTSL